MGPGSPVPPPVPPSLPPSSPPPEDDGPAANDRQFPCSQCGASLYFVPGTDTLVCPYCRHANVIAVSDRPVQELDYRAGLSELSGAAGLDANPDTVEVLAVSCDGCGAQINAPDGTTAFDCPFCGHAINAQAQSQRLIKPRSLLPFVTKRAEANTLFAQWLGSRWFLPTRLARRGKHDGKLTGVYLPFWTFDSRTDSQYSGQRGTHYWVTQHYTTRVNGKTVNRTRQVRKTRWRSVRGHVAMNFDDVLVVASQSLPVKLTGPLEPWDLQSLVPFDEAYLAGFRAEIYQVGLPQGFDHAKQVMAQAIRVGVRRDIGGDEQRISHVDTRHQDVSFKHLLLPVWASAYRWRGKVYRFVVNARTGEVQGERPYSFWKIAGVTLAVLAVVGGAVAIFGATR